MVVQSPGQAYQTEWRLCCGVLRDLIKKKKLNDVKSIRELVKVWRLLRKICKLNAKCIFHVHTTVVCAVILFCAAEVVPQSNKNSHVLRWF